MAVNVLIFISCVFSGFVCLFSILCILCSFIVLFIVSLVVHSSLFPMFVQVYGPLLLGGNYHIMSLLPVFVPVDAYICHVSYVFLLVLSRIGNIWVWSPGGIPRSLPFLIHENSSRPKFLTPSNTY